MKVNEVKVYAFYIGVALLPGIADEVHGGLRKMQANRVTKLFVKVSNLIVLSAALNLLCQKVRCKFIELITVNIETNSYEGSRYFNMTIR